MMKTPLNKFLKIEIVEAFLLDEAISGFPSISKSPNVTLDGPLPTPKFTIGENEIDPAVLVLLKTDTVDI